jgi:hypothetical protein
MVAAGRKSSRQEKGSGRKSGNAYARRRRAAYAASANDWNDFICERP